MITVRVNYKETAAKIEFPCDESYLYAKLSELHIPDEEKVSSKFFIEEVMDFDELKCLEENFVDLDELNYFAKRFDSMDSRGTAKIKAAISLGGFKTMPDLINLTFNEHYYTLIQDMSSPEKIGKTHMLTRKGGMSESEMLSYDFSKIGKNLIQSGQAKLTAYGLLVTNDDLEYERPYNGRTFPAFYYDGRRIGLMLENNGAKECIYLPDLPIAIGKALRRLGAEKVEECTAQFDSINYPNKEIDAILKKILENNGVYALNALANTIRVHCTEEALNNLPDLVEYIGAEDFDTIMRLSEETDSFVIMRNVSDDTELGRRWMADYTDCYLDEDVMDFFDFDAYGEYIRELTEGKFMNNGDYICVEQGLSLKEILGRTNDQSSDMTMEM